MPAAPITTVSGINDVVAAGRAAGRIGLDTEFMREKTYRARLCLVQVSTPDDVVLIDTVAVDDLSAIAALVGDPDVEVVLHAGLQDLQILYERYGVLPRSIFDVQLAAGFVGLGASLPYGRLVSSVLGVQLEKGESYSDWCRRPLTDAQARYAADDVIHLLPLRDGIGKKLESLGRAAWAAEEMELLCREELFEVDPGEAWRRVGGRGVLSSKQTAVLKELARWREEAAARRDLPRGWIVKDPTLIELARRAPRDIGGLKSIRGMNAREAERAGREILDAVAAGLAAPPVDGPQAPPRSLQARARMLSGLADGVVRARCERAEVATELVATRGELENLLVAVLDGDADLQRHRLMTGWRRELAGNAVVALARGEVAVRAIDRPPYIEEVELPAGR